MRFKALSLIDITKTGVSRNKEAEDQKAVAQFANYMTVENCLQLRSNIKILTGPKSKKMDIFLDSMRRIKGDLTLPWLHLDKAKMKGIFESIPERDDMQLTINEQLVVELYSK